MNMETQRSEDMYANAMSGANSGLLQSQPQMQSKPEHEEGQLARTIEERTAKLSSDTYLWAALGSMALSFFLQMSGKQRASLFVGQWAPTFLILGLYNKLVKVSGTH